MDENSTIRVYKCPSCGGAVKYDAHTNSLRCAWCGNEYEPGALEAREVVSEWQECLCPECGAAVMTLDFIAADTCPYCGNNEVGVHRFEGEFEPDFIIPFAITKKDAIVCYERAVAEKEYLPDDFRSQARVVSMQGVYVPFWLHSGTVDFDYRYRANWRFAKDSGAYVNHDTGTYAFVRVPADGSVRMPDIVMDSIEPYQYGALVPFSAEYLPGFAAERYTVSQIAVQSRISYRVKNSARHAVEARVISDVGNSTIESFHYDEGRSRDAVHYSVIEQALFPVWLLVVMYGGRKILLGINGQTGKVSANLPIDEKKEKTATWEAVGKGVLLAAASALVYGVAIAVKSGTSGAHVRGGVDPTVFLIVLAMFAFFAVVIAREFFTKKKREVDESMHTVKFARDADAYGTGNLMVKTHVSQSLGALEAMVADLEE